MVARLFFAPGFNIAPHTFAVFLDRRAGVNMVDPPAEVFINAHWEAKIKKRIVSGAGCLATEGICPTPFDNRFQSAELIRMVTHMAEFVLGFEYIIRGGRNIDIAEPDHGVFGFGDIFAKLAESLKPGHFVIPFIDTDLCSVWDIGVNYLNALIDRADDSCIFGHVGVAESGLNVFNRALTQEANAIVTGLPMDRNFISGRFEFGKREFGIFDFGFLNRDEVGLSFFEPFEDTGDSGADGVDVESRDSHGM